MLTQKQISEFQDKIFSWWQENKRDLPWRHTNDPYHIVVSELMLQQTQVGRVIPKYHAFLQSYPNIKSLANATPAQVIMLWQGLGYNRRSLYLLRLAQSLEDKPFPQDELALLRLPGIGLYTARAIQVFAFKKDIAAVDTNIRQIIEQEFFGSISQTSKIIQSTADQLVPAGRSWEWHQALMDYGSIALVRVKKPKINTIKFKDSNRFLRGRIVDLLRKRPHSKSDIESLCIDQFGKSIDQIDSCLSSLVKDKLIIKKIDSYSLP